MKSFIHVIVIVLFLIPIFMFEVAINAQDSKTQFTSYGYSSKSPEYFLESANYAVQYLRTQTVLNNQTKDQESLVDTLTLVIGNRWSVFYNTNYNARFSAWGRQNIKKTRQATKSASLEIIPLSLVLDKKNASKDYIEGNFGEPTLVYADHRENRIISVLYAPFNILNEQNYDYEWNLQEGQDSVLNYECKRAELYYKGRNYTAWYATEIPIPYGPWKFCGLPGLILKVKDEDGLVAYEVIGLESLDNAFITMNDNLEKVPLLYFNQVANEARSKINGSFLFDGELFFTESQPYSYPEIELKTK